MSLAVAIQMDPIEQIDIDTDSTFLLALEAQSRGHLLFHYLPRDLSLKNGRVVARARALRMRREAAGRWALGSPETLDLATMDVILLRQRPPFDMAFVTATHLLEHVSDRALVVNHPANVRNASERLYVSQFGKLMPPTLITTDLDEVMAFRAEHRDIIIKPLYRRGDASTFHVAPGDGNLTALLELFTQLYREPIVVQRYVPEVRQGDRRVIMVDGAAAGAFDRIPKVGETRSSLQLGGTAAKATLTRHQREICEMIGPSLREHGLIFACLHVIGDYLTEIDVAAPNGLQDVNRFDDARLEARIWDVIESRHGDRRASYRA